MNLNRAHRKLRYTNSTRLAGFLAIFIGVGMLTAAAPPAQSGQRESSDWINATITNTLAGYVVYLHDHPAGYHAIRARMRLESLVKEDLSNVKEVDLVMDAPSFGRAGLPTAGWRDQIIAALAEEGVSVVEGDCLNQITASLVTKHWVAGTSDSYWHPALAAALTLTFSRIGTGPIFSNVYADVNVDPVLTISIPDLAVRPADSAQLNFIDPISRAVSGTGIEFTPASDAATRNDAGAKAEPLELLKYNWASRVDQEKFKRLMTERPPLRIDDETGW
jgi:hypothetical protein